MSESPEDAADRQGRDVTVPDLEPRVIDCTGDYSAAEVAQSAKQVIQAGQCLVMPTDTVYGICADAFDARAVQRLLNAKQRGRDMPPPVLVGDPGVLPALASDVSEQATRLTQAHWPGPLTIICTAQRSLRMDLGETRGTIAVRVPDLELACQVLRRTGPLAVSSANISGQDPATNITEATEQLGLDVALYLDGGPSSGMPPSTIVDFTRFAEGEVVREGALSLAELRRTVPELRSPDDTDPDPDVAEAIEEAMSDEDSSD